MEEVRCLKCGRLLLKMLLIIGTVEIKCRCHHLNTIIADKRDDVVLLLDTDYV